MRYYVIHHSGSRDYEIAATRYIEDARAILARYYAGYIISNGAILESKRIEEN